MLNKLRRATSSLTTTTSSSSQQQQPSVPPVLEGPLMCMEIVNGGKDVKWSARHCQIFSDARVVISAKKDQRPLRTEKLTGDHFVADAKFTNGWQISDFKSILYFASASEREKSFWMHAVQSVIRKLLEPTDALPPQYATVAMHRHSHRLNKGPAFDEARKATTTTPEEEEEELPPKEPQEPKAKEEEPEPKPKEEEPKPKDVVVKDVAAAEEKEPLLPEEEEQREAVVAEEREPSSEGRPPPPPLPTVSLSPAAEATRQDDELDEAVASLSRERALAASLRSEVEALTSARSELERELAEAAERLRVEEVAREDAESHVAKLKDAEERRTDEVATLAKRVADLEAEAEAAASAPAPKEDPAGDAKWLKALEMEQDRTAKTLAENKRLQHKVAKAETDKLKKDGELASMRLQLNAAKEGEAGLKDKTKDLQRRFQAAEAELDALKKRRSEKRRSASQSMTPLPEVDAAAAVHIDDGLPPVATTKKKRAVPPPPARAPPTTTTKAPPPPPPPPPPPRHPKKPSQQRPLSTEELEEALVKETAKMWEKRAEQISEEQKTNVFSKHYVGKQATLDGRPEPGSATELRWEKGKAWVDEQIDNLVEAIQTIGHTDDNATTVDFGTLFYHYADVSDSLVGILMRAKKRHRLYYDGDMLFQSKDDHVIITVPVAA